MSAANAPVQQGGETASNFKYRLQQYYPPTSGPNTGMAAGWLALIVKNPAPRGYTVL
jgi:hypothetical protein